MSDELHRLRSENAYMRGKLEVLGKAIASLKQQVDQTDPNCPVGVALTKAACEALAYDELGVGACPHEPECVESWWRLGRNP